jgi:peptidoglycan hydrolase CwlO-like protein
MKEELDKLESDKKDLEAKLKSAEHAAWSIKVDIKAVEKKIERTKELMKP